MEVLRTYVIRIYRQDEDDLAGVVEAVDTGESTGFHSLAELCAAVFHRNASGRQVPIENYWEIDK